MIGRLHQSKNALQPNRLETSALGAGWKVKWISFSKVSTFFST